MSVGKVKTVHIPFYLEADSATPPNSWSYACGRAATITLAKGKASDFTSLKSTIKEAKTGFLTLNDALKDKAAELKIAPIYSK